MYIKNLLSYISTDQSFSHFHNHFQPQSTHMQCLCGFNCHFYTFLVFHIVKSTMFLVPLYIYKITTGMENPSFFSHNSSTHAHSTNHPPQKKIYTN
jgi:hypothetical protein